MEKIIIYDKDNSFFEILSEKISEDFNNIYVELFNTLEELHAALKENIDQYIFSIIDINSEPDNAQVIINLLSNYFIPVLALSSTDDDHLRDAMVRKYSLIDFTIKSDSKNYQYISTLVTHMRNTRDIQTLLVSDSQYDRDYIYNNLKQRYPFEIIDAKNKEEVKTAFNHSKNIKIAIIDIMPEELGLEIVEQIREFNAKESLAIMAVTSKEHTYLAARYLHAGANDFLIKPIENDSFNSRIDVMIDTLSLFNQLQKLANIDYLTGLKNRRYFYEAGNMLFANARRKNISIATAIMDIDYFKKVNDTYGHDAGDLVLKEVAQLLANSFRSSDLIARIGGEEFAVILVDADENIIEKLFEKFKKDTEALVINSPQQIKVTVSIGITTSIGENLETTIKVADNNLYEAKRTGRNKIILSN